MTAFRCFLRLQLACNVQCKHLPVHCLTQVAGSIPTFETYPLSCRWALRAFNLCLTTFLLLFSDSRCGPRRDHTVDLRTPSSRDEHQQRLSIVPFQFPCESNRTATSASRRGPERSQSERRGADAARRAAKARGRPRDCSSGARLRREFELQLQGSAQVPIASRGEGTETPSRGCLPPPGPSARRKDRAEVRERRTETSGYRLFFGGSLSGETNRYPTSRYYLSVISNCN